MKQLRNSFLKWLVVSLLCLLLGFLFGKFKQNILRKQLIALSVDQQAMQIRNETLKRDFARLQISADTEQQTIKSLLESNKQLQDELLIANNKLFFYERIIAPELETTGVKVYSFTVVKNDQTKEWDYELVLMQSQKEHRFLNGNFDITLAVFEDENLKQIALTELSEDLRSDFKFKYFQTIQGSFSLSENTTVDEVIVSLNVVGDRWHKAQSIEERYDWRILTVSDVNDLID